MNWEWLKGLFPALKSVNLRLLNNISVSLFSNNAKATYIVDSRTLNVNWNQLTEKEKQTILRRAPKLVNRGMPVLEEDFNSKADDYVAKIGESDNDELLNYFKEKIPLEDFPILKASLYLRSVLRNGGETRGLKEEISRRYGLRGEILVIYVVLATLRVGLGQLMKKCQNYQNSPQKAFLRFMRKLF